MDQQELDARAKWIEECLASAPEVRKEFVTLIAAYQEKVKSLEKDVEGLKQKLKLLGALPQSGEANPSATTSSTGPPSRPPPARPLPEPPKAPAPLPAPSTFDRRFSSFAQSELGQPPRPELSRQRSIGAMSARIEKPPKSWRQSLAPQAQLLMQANRRRTETVSAVPVQSNSASAYATLPRAMRNPTQIESDPFAPHLSNPNARAQYTRALQARQEKESQEEEEEVHKASKVTFGPPIPVYVSSVSPPRPPNRPPPAAPVSSSETVNTTADASESASSATASEELQSSEQSKGDTEESSQDIEDKNDSTESTTTDQTTSPSAQTTSPSAEVATDSEESVVPPTLNQTPALTSTSAPPPYFPPLPPQVPTTSEASDNSPAIENSGDEKAAEQQDAGATAAVSLSNSSTYNSAASSASPLVDLFRPIGSSGSSASESVQLRSQKLELSTEKLLDELSAAAREGALQKAELEKIRKQEKLEVLNVNWNLSNEDIRKLRKTKTFKKLQKQGTISLPVNFRHLMYLAETYELERVFHITKDFIEPPTKRRLDEEAKLDPELIQKIKVAKDVLAYELDISNYNLATLPLTVVENFNKVRVLDLSQNKFTAYPPELRSFDLLEELNLSNNIIPALPPFINKLQRLRVLRIDNCSLGSLPIELCQLPLEVIDISSNALQEIPKWIGHLTELHYLDISRCPGITSLPAEMGHLRQLEYFDFSDCRVKKMPREICNLTELKVLRLASNHIEKLPSHIGNLTQLVELVISNNKLTDLPVSLGNCAMLSAEDAVFDISGNPLPKIIMDAFESKSRADFVSFLQSRMKGHKFKVEMYSVAKLPTVPKPAEPKISVLDKFTLQEKMLCLSEWAVSITETYLKPALVKISQQIKSLTSTSDEVLLNSLLPKFKRMKTLWRRTEDFLPKLDRQFKLDTSKSQLEQIQSILLDELATIDTTARQVRDVIRDKAMTERVEDIVAVVSTVHYLRDLLYICNS